MSQQSRLLSAFWFSSVGEGLAFILTMVAGGLS
jgi:hypothetical protein